MTATERDRLVVLEEKVSGIDKKLDKVIEDHEERIRALEKKPNDCTDKVKDHEERLRTIESAPAKKWEKVVSAAIGAVVGTGLGALIASLIK